MESTANYTPRPTCPACPARFPTLQSSVPAPDWCGHRAPLASARTSASASPWVCRRAGSKCQRPSPAACGFWPPCLWPGSLPAAAGWGRPVCGSACTTHTPCLHLENGNTGARPHTPAPLEADCHEIHETAASLLATLGQPIFEALTGAPERVDGKNEAPELFYCRGPEANGVGEYTSEGFVVHKGSTARIEIVASIKGTSQERFRQQLVPEGVLALDGNHYVFTRDHLFASPSMAAIAVLGRSANGWIEWKTAQGQTLDGAKRQSVKVVA